MEPFIARQTPPVVENRRRPPHTIGREHIGGEVTPVHVDQPPIAADPPQRAPLSGQPGFSAGSSARARRRKKRLEVWASSAHCGEKETSFWRLQFR
ncbi:MAG: hypothetical protein P4K98_12985 [Bryobacteraceae bacterium]|nr:hypothetical protein [Bryobacteraceae bacterium]